MQAAKADQREPRSCALVVLRLRRFDSYPPPLNKTSNVHVSVLRQRDNIEAINKYGTLPQEARGCGFNSRSLTIKQS